MRILQSLAGWPSLMVFPLLAGCALAGNVASSMQQDQKVEASYSGLRGQQVGIMVWADPGVTIDYPEIQQEIAHSLQDKLQQAASEHANEVQNIQWVKADDILSFQNAHPEYAADSADELAARLGVGRLIYVEVLSLSMHPNDAADLTRGSADADVEVVEVANGKGKTAYRDQVAVQFPKSAPDEGMPNMDERVVYQQTIASLTTGLADKFVTHEESAQ